MSPVTYLVFGDLHGRALPAFKLAQAWSREHGVALAGLLQVGDLCGSVEASRSKTSQRSPNDSLDGDLSLFAHDAEEADTVFADPSCPEAMWFTAGNHEDFDLLKQAARTANRGTEHFPIDGYGKLRCLRDGRVAELPGGLRLGALWGIGDRVRRRIPPGARISSRSTAALSSARFDVLLTHESPRDAIHANSGCDEIGEIIRGVQPAFAFFGHYHRTGRQVAGDFGVTRVYHLSHLELDSRAEEGSVGVLTWTERDGSFSYLDPEWLRTVTCHNWRHR